MTTQVSLSVSHTSLVTPDQIDELGHMNVRFYGQNAIAGTLSVCERLGVGSRSLVSSYTRHHHEQMEGNQLEVRSGVLGGGQRLRIFHELRNRDNDDLAATFVHELDHQKIDGPKIELPTYAHPRSLNLNTNGLAVAPSLDELRARGLAIRLSRRVDNEDTNETMQVPSWLANNLIWGGERPDGEDDGDWIRTAPSGDRLSFATMESRLWIGRLPTLGTRIQSFGCVVDVGEKISHGMNWAYDLDTEEPLAVFETINLAFNITARKAVMIPPAMRADEVARLHVDLAVPRSSQVG